MAEKYVSPEFLAEQCSPQAFRRWLHRKALSHRKRDRKRKTAPPTTEEYKIAIHKAVMESVGKDFYTGKQLRWNQISTFNNDEAKAGGREYKKSFGDLPSLDHATGVKPELSFRICSWRTNDAKNDLEYDEFVQLCRDVLKHRPTTLRNLKKHR